MNIKNHKILVFGGWGLVGLAVCRRLFEEQPKEIILHSLRKEEAIEAVEMLQKEASEKEVNIKFKPAWGNIFVRKGFSELSRNELLDNKTNRRTLIADVFDNLSDDILKDSTLYQILVEHKPDAIVDCVNTATGVAYQNVFVGGNSLRSAIENSDKNPEILLEESEKLLTSIYIPQLIRHIQVLYDSMKAAETSVYVKVGTSGTGGMGLNIPYTHSEEKPSRVLLAKSSVAGAHSLLLFLLGRTYDSPIVKEIKPSAAIAWKKIEYGEVKKGGNPVELYDCTTNEAIDLSNGVLDKTESKAKKLNETLKSVFIDTGENGIFSTGEYTTISSLQQMEMVTPEEIAQKVIFEIRGRNTGNDIVAALDASVLNPTYRAGFLRNSALEKMRELEKEHNTESVAFELLGPPRLSKLLYEVFLLKKTCGNLGTVLSKSVEELQEKVQNLIQSDSKIRSEAISVGIPILLGDGKSLLRSPQMKIPVLLPRQTKIEFNKDDFNQWAYDGWIDLRKENLALWQERAEKLVAEFDEKNNGQTGSGFDFEIRFGNRDSEIDIGKVASWVFEKEENGFRIK